MRPTPPHRKDFPYIITLTTRWMDNDTYGHLNNAVHYSLFDTVINRWLYENQLTDPKHPFINLVVQSGCDYFAELRYPIPIDAGLRVTKIGRSSVRYEVALFDDKAEIAAAAGHVVQVFVERESHAATAPPDFVTTALKTLLVPQQDAV